MESMNFDDLPWEDIKEISEKGIFEDVFKRISKGRFEFVAKPENFDSLAESALKSLQKKNTDATYKQAYILAKIMQSFARKILIG